MYLCRLKKRYRQAIGGKVQIDEMYEGYLKSFCAPKLREPQRKCDFGKAVKKAFPSVKNRRLGPVGRQLAYYCGIAQREVPLTKANFRENEREIEQAVNRNEKENHPTLANEKRKRRKDSSHANGTKKFLETGNRRKNNSNAAKRRGYSSDDEWLPTPVKGQQKRKGKKKSPFFFHLHFIRSLLFLSLFYSIFLFFYFAKTYPSNCRHHLFFWLTILTC